METLARIASFRAYLVTLLVLGPMIARAQEGEPNAYARMLAKEAHDRAAYSICREYQSKREALGVTQDVAEAQRNVDSLLRGDTRPAPPRAAADHGHDCDADRSVWEADVLWLTTHTPPKGTKRYEPEQQDWPKEPKDYHGIRFGAGEKDVLPAIRARGNYKVKFQKDLFTPVPTRSAGIGVGLMNEKYTLYDDKLGQIRLEFESSDYEALRDAFIARYGPPHSIENGTVQNGFGATFPQEEVRWVGEHVVIWLERYGYRLTRGFGIVATTDFLAVTGKAEAEAKRERADR